MTGTSTCPPLRCIRCRRAFEMGEGRYWAEFDNGHWSEAGFVHADKCPDGPKWPLPKEAPK